MMSGAEALLADAYQRYRQGDLAGAEQIARQVAAKGHEVAALSALLGMVALQSGRTAESLPHLRTALADTPDSLPLRISFAFALANTGHYDETRRVAAVADVPQLRRIIAFVDQQEGATQAAVAGYRRVLADYTGDYESWYNLGLLLSELGEIDEAVEAYRKALAINVQPAFHIALSKALAKVERHGERCESLRAATARFPADVPLCVELGLAEHAAGDFAAAEAAFRRALERDPRHIPAYVEYGMLLEALNRLDALEALVASARAAGLDAPAIGFIEAWLLKRRGRFAEALPLAEAAVCGVSAGRRAQLIGELADRMGDADRAFAAFTEMNRLSAEGPASAYARAQDFPGHVRSTITRLTADRVAAWSRAEPSPGLTAPVFIVGFPRSGTTLLDTLLMNLPELDVLEEEPIVERIEAMIDLDSTAIDTSTSRDIDAFRTTYFDLLSKIRPDRDEKRLIVDKFPMNLVRTALIGRIFPDSPIVFVERHPCDVVLSCFMARFQINRAMVQFHDIENAAKLYHLSMEAWTRTAALLPLRVHHVRYERMIADLDGEMRALLAFLDLPWRDTVLDNRTSAARRVHIATASYAQVAEPIHARASGRWRRYRRHLEPVLPILTPWVERFGYSLD